MPQKMVEMNQDLADRINAEARSNPQSPYANRLVVVANDLDELVRQLRLLEPDPKKCFGVEASRDCEVHEIWSM